MNSCRSKILLLVLFVAGSPGMGGAQPYYFNHYQVESGLSNNSVECSIQDDDEIGRAHV